MDSGVPASVCMTKEGMYRLLAEPAGTDEDEPPPDTTLTRQIEALDNDRAIAGLAGAGLPLP
ncbi:hypothetical protein [Nonomuraea sp. NPDC049695]|uniref:hypothetical protein n=1 Tax=Nonomuraea sp. NPDC049695 TaxID=3154734 RepID=UPI00341581B6